MSNFVAEQANVAIYDPKVKEAQIWKELIEYGGSEEVLKLNVEICSTAYAACEAADAVIIMTEWDEFSNKLEEHEQLVLKEVSPNRMQVPERSMNHERPRANSFATSVKPQVENMTGSTTTIRSFDVKLDLVAGPTHLDWGRIADGMRKPRYVFDGRNMLDHAKLEALGFRVEAIGKASRKSSSFGC